MSQMFYVATFELHVDDNVTRNYKTNMSECHIISVKVKTGKNVPDHVLISSSRSASILIIQYISDITIRLPTLFMDTLHCAQSNSMFSNWDHYGHLYYFWARTNQ